MMRFVFSLYRIIEILLAGLSTLGLCLAFAPDYSKAILAMKQIATLKTKDQDDDNGGSKLVNKSPT